MVPKPWHPSEKRKMCSSNTSVKTPKPLALYLLYVSEMHNLLNFFIYGFLVNVGILGATGYLTYSKWNRWDTRTFATLAAGFASFGLGESYLVSHI